MKTAINTAGLYRCCLDTFNEFDHPANNGDRIECKHCHDEMVVELVDDTLVWRWAGSFRTKGRTE